MDAQEELAFLRSVAASQLQTIKALTLGCEKYGLTETTPVVRHLAAQDDEIERLRAELAECKQDAERYRHLLRHHIRSDPDMSGRHHWMTLGRGIGRGATAGEAIDAARKGEGE